MAFSFEGIKFYLSIHTPNRIKRDIQNNGGIVVANEKNADVRIVDPSRSIQSHRTGDFYSHQWITDCIRQKRRIDETPYLISTVATRHASRPQEERSQHQTSERSGGLVYAPARPLAPSQKRSRNAFTYEDDRILIDWVTREAEKAVKGEEKFLDRGNDMYKKLEEKYPHHTFHSWRNRWLTKLSMTTSIPVAKRPQQPQRQPRLEPRREPQEEPEEEPGDQPHAQSQEPQEQPREEPQEQQRDEAQDRVQEDSARDGNSGRPGDLFFMDYTDYFIIAKSYSAWKKERRESGASAKPTASFFDDLHEKYPDISRTELRRRYYRLRDLYTKADTVPADAPAEEAPAETPAVRRANHHSEIQNGGRGDEQGGAVEDNNENAADDIDLDDDAILNGVGDLDSDQQEFQECLNQYNDYLQVYVPPSFFIGGRYLETYSLWTAIQIAADEHDRIDWGVVIDTLGLDSTKFSRLASQLAAWYELNLKEFRSFWKRYTEQAQDAEDGESEDDEEDEDEVQAEAEEVAQEPPSGPAPGSARRSTGLMASLRGIASAFTGGETAGDAPVPESPNKHVRFSGVQPGQDNHHGHASDPDDDDDSDDNGSPAFETRRRTRSSTQQRTPKKKTALEPETQDFAFDPETQPPTDLGGDDDEEEEGLDDDDGEDWQVYGTPSKATPARQLRSEERIVSAVPQSLPAPGSAKRKRTAAISASASPAKRLQRKSMSAI